MSNDEQWYEEQISELERRIEQDQKDLQIFKHKLHTLRILKGEK